MKRVLTKKYTGFALGQHQKKTGETPVDIMDIGNLSIVRIAQLVQLGNPNCSEEESYTLLDDYLAMDDDNSLLSAYFTLLDEYDRDFKILRASGVSVDDLKEKAKESMQKNTDKMLKAPLDIEEVEQ